MNLRDKIPYTTHHTPNIKFVIIRFKIKTMVVAVVDAKTNIELGRIESIKGRYTFTSYNIKPNNRQLTDILTFINTINVPRKYKPKTIGVICKDYNDFQDWSRIRGHNKRWGIQRKYTAGNNTYIALSHHRHLCGYRFDRIEYTDNAKLNPQFDAIVTSTVYCLP